MQLKKIETKSGFKEGEVDDVAPPIITPETPVGRMFSGRSVFITGASGFIGRVLLEKLIRSYLSIRCIYILMRYKKNQNPADRLHKQLLNAPIFDAIRAKPNGSELLDKIVVIAGDIGRPNLGISDEDMQTMLNDKTLSIVFHSAATIKFDEPLKQSVKLNLIATKTIIDFCRRLPNLISICHVSTAYANSDIKDQQPIEERLYPMKQKPEHLIRLAEMLNEDLMQLLKTKLVDQRPNTYTYTKALTEHMIADGASDLPVVMVRPTIVVAAWKEPLPGWIDNLNGPTGLILAIGKGLCRSLYVNHKVIADMIPVDVVVNTMIASAFHVSVACKKLDSNGFPMESGQVEKANQKRDLIRESTNLPSVENSNNENATSTIGSTGKPDALDQSPLVVHCNSGQLNPITWGGIREMFFPILRKYPSCHVIRYPSGTMKSNYYHDLIARVFVHYIPALVLDVVCCLIGKNAKLLSIYGKLHGAIAALRHFCTQNYNFRTNNMIMIHKGLCEADQRDLYVDIEHLNWYNFWSNYTLGVRKFLLKEEDSTLPEAHKSLSRSLERNSLTSEKIDLDVSREYVNLSGTVQFQSESSEEIVCRS